MNVSLFKPSLDIARRNFWSSFFDEDRDIFSRFVPAVNIKEDPEQYVLSVELPGMKKEDVKIEFKENLLTISGERKMADEEKREGYHRIEHGYGQFSRSFTLPQGVKADQIEARYTDGILTISVPKAEEIRPKQIEIH